MILLIFTNAYPYDVMGEQTFLAGEIGILRKYFDRIVLVPQNKYGKTLPLPPGVEAALDFSARFSFAKRIPAFLSSLSQKDVYDDIRGRFPGSLSPAYLKKMFFFLSAARQTQHWLKNWMKKENASARDVMCYSYWFTEITMGLGWVRAEEPALRVVSRAHGYDLYEELYKPWPLRRKSISLSDAVFADSDIGANYLREKYPQFKEKYEAALLGVPDPGGIASPSSDGVLRLVSCSNFHPVKRIDLLFESVVVAAKKRPAQRIKWTHFGGAEEIRRQYTQRVAGEFPANAEAFFPGYQSQPELIQTYLSHPADVFLNVSSTEGTSVAMMEAVSCGIPVIAAAVGGNVEIVQERNGVLLSENPTPDEIANALLQVCDNRERWLTKRQGSREVWRERYNETTNFEAFAQKLVEIRKR